MVKRDLVKGDKQEETVSALFGRHSQASPLCGRITNGSDLSTEKQSQLESERLRLG